MKLLFKSSTMFTWSMPSLFFCKLFEKSYSFCKLFSLNYYFFSKLLWEVCDREWDGWMTSSTQWTWVWANFGRWWRTGKPTMLQSMVSQRVRHDWVTEQQKLLLNLSLRWLLKFIFWDMILNHEKLGRFF